MQYGLTIATEPSVEPCTLADVKGYSRVTLDVDDAILTRQIAAGRKLAEQRTRRAFISTTFDLWLDRWWARELVLPAPPCQSVSYVKYRDTDGAWQTVDSAEYELDATEEPARVVNAYGYSWPSIIKRRKAVNVRYVAGYGDAATDVPSGIIEAIAAYVLSLYDERGVIVVGTIASVLPFSAINLLDHYMVRDYALTQGGD